MSSYATPADLSPVASAYEVAVPADGGLRDLELGSRDLDRHLLGAGTLDVTLLNNVQVAALKDAACVQACFRISQGPEMTLAVDDGLAAVGGVSFTGREARRLSPEAAERVSGIGLYRRSGTAAPTPPLTLPPTFP